MADLDRERIAATTDLSNERGIVLNAIHEEEIAAMTDLNTLSQQTLNDLDKRSRRLLNYLFCLGITLVLITLVVCFVFAWILLQRFSSSELARHEYHGHAA
jgi:t-SNARE complex subunit (syntaxin)